MSDLDENQTSALRALLIALVRLVIESQADLIALTALPVSRLGIPREELEAACAHPRQGFEPILPLLASTPPEDLALQIAELLARFEGPVQ